MTAHRAMRLCGFLLLVLAASQIPLCSDYAQAAEGGYSVIKQYCFACHGEQNQKGSLRLDSAAGLRAGGDSGAPLVVPGKLGESLLWKRLAVDGDMPPKDKPQPTPEERELIRQWIIAGGVYPSAVGAGEAEDIAAKALDVFRQHCIRCHGDPQQKAAGLDMRNVKSLLATLPGQTKPYVVLGESGEAIDPDDSPLWRKIDSGAMPPKGFPRPTEEDKQIVLRWIRAGAPAYTIQQDVRKRVDELSVHTAIRRHLENTREAFRPHQRYFTLHHLHNNPTISDQTLRLFKAALSKVINSLTFEATIVVPKQVDDAGTVFAVDLRQMGWTNDKHWKPLMAEYPFALKFEDHDQLSKQVLLLAGQPLPFLRIRADWFIVKASRPPLYYTLLGLPATVSELEKKLDVDAEQDFLNSDLARGVVLTSGVSSQNRVLDRHRALHGAYWKSYDFIKNSGKGELAANPLGPNFTNNPFKDRAFEQDGGEMIFHLPNGLQGYYLCDKTGKRIDEGPASIVSDPNQWSGTPIIVNGLSCMGCHKNGIFRFRDVLRSNAHLGGDQRIKFEDVFVDAKTLNELFTADEERFLAAIVRAVGPFLGIETNEQARNLEFEPVGKLAQFYHGDMTLETVAAEIGVDSTKLRNAIEFNPNLNTLLSTLRDKETAAVKRTNWEARDGNRRSLMQKAVQELNQTVVPQDFSLSVPAN